VLPGRPNLDTEIFAVPASGVGQGLPVVMMTVLPPWTNLLAKEVPMSGDAVAQFNIHDAKTNLSRIIERVERGEEIIISRAGHPVARVVPLVHRIDRRGRGSLRGRLVMAEDWDSDEVNEGIAQDFGITS
jgi:prevent-host-death family protein